MDAPEIAKIHAPVLAKEVIEYLAPKEGGRYLDGTVGLGGHAAMLLEAAPGLALCGLDRDAEALELARVRLAGFGDRVHLFHLPFNEFAQALESLGWRKLDGAFLDLGVSSLQLDRDYRGFSFKNKGPLDMRMDQGSDHACAEDIVNHADLSVLRDIIAIYGEDACAGKIAKKIIEARQKAPIADTCALAEIVCQAYPPAWRRNARRHPATRVFQALRMAVNEEEQQLKSFLATIWDWLAPGARLAIISFHSLEDRLVKKAMKKWAAKGAELDQPAAVMLHKKPLVASAEELSQNPRASSAKLRVIEKTG